MLVAGGRVHVLGVRLTHVLGVGDASHGRDDHLRELARLVALLGDGGLLALLDDPGEDQEQQAGVADEGQPDARGLQVGLVAGSGDVLGLGTDGTDQGADADDFQGVAELDLLVVEHDVQDGLGQKDPEHGPPGVLTVVLQVVHVARGVREAERSPYGTDGQDDHDDAVEAVLVLVQALAENGGEQGEEREHEGCDDGEDVFHHEPSRRPKRSTLLSKNCAVARFLHILQ